MDRDLLAILHVEVPQGFQDIILLRKSNLLIFSVLVNLHL